MWLSVKEASELLDITDRAVRKHIDNGRFKVKKIKGKHGGRGGKSYKIHISSLPPEARMKYLDKFRSETDNELSQNKSIPYFEDASNASQQLNEYINKYGTDAVDKAIQVEAAIQDIGASENRKEIGTKTKYWAAQFGVTEKTIRYWRRKYSSDGFIGLLRRNRQDKGSRKNTCEAAADRLKYVYLSGNQPTIREAHRQVMREVKDTSSETCNVCYYFESCDDEEKIGWKIGSYKTATRILDELEFGEKELYRSGLQKCRANAMPKGRVDFTKYLVNERWVSDHHDCDFYCIDERGYLAKPQLTIWQDSRSRVVTGLALSFQGNAKVIGLAFAHGMLPKPNSPIKGFPKEALMDNGKDYRSHYLGRSEKFTGKREFSSEMRGLFSTLGIEPHYCKPYSPWGKINESFFRTFKMQFSVHMPGYTGGTPEARPENHEKELKKLQAKGMVPTLTEAFNKIIDWINNEYHVTEHSELGDTPLNVYLTAPRYEGGIVSKEVAAVLLYDKVERTVRRDGIYFNNNLYKSRELYEMQGKKVVVKYDPFDLDEVIIESKGKVICLAERYTPMRTQEDVENNAKEQAYYMGRLKDKYKNYKQGFTPTKRKKSKEIVTGEVLDRPGEDDVVRVTGIEQAAKKRNKKSSSKKKTAEPNTQGSLAHQWYEEAFNEFKNQAGEN
jgi:putative transposase